MMSQLISACIFLSGLLPPYFIVAVFPAAAPAIVSLRVAYFHAVLYIIPSHFPVYTFYSACASFFRCPSAHDFPLPPRSIYRVFTFSPRFFSFFHPSVTSVLELVRAVTPSPPPPPFPSRQLLAPHTTTRYATPLQTAATRSQRLRRLPER